MCVRIERVVFKYIEINADMITKRNQETYHWKIFKIFLRNDETKIRMWIIRMWGVNG